MIDTAAAVAAVVVSMMSLDVVLLIALAVHVMPCVI